MRSNTYSKLITVLVFVALSSEVFPQDGRTDFFHPETPQFVFHYPTTNHRQIELLRAGNGDQRPSESTVFEIIESGRKLKKIHNISLANIHRPHQQIYMPGGRFLVTCGDIDDASTNDNCLVVYDLILKQRTKFRLEEFLSVAAKEKLRPLGYTRGKEWNGRTTGAFDRENQLYYPTLPEECRNLGLPFLVVDLCSRLVRETDVPKQLPLTSSQIEIQGTFLSWEWAMKEKNEPQWTEKFKYPDLIKCTVESQRGPDGFASWGWTKREMYYELVPESGDYISCDRKNWLKAIETKERGKTKGTQLID